MTVDEMDLASQALDVTPWRPEEYERARAVLRGAMTESGPRLEAGPVPTVVPLPARGSSRAGNRRRRTLGTRGKIGIGAGLGAVAAGVAAALVITSAPSATPTSTGLAVKAPVVQSKLMSLAAFIKANSGPLPGDASLIIRHQPAPAGAVEVTYNLYTDSGDLYVTDTEKALAAAVADHANLADGSAARELAAARYAAKGDLATAREQMDTALGNNDYYDSLAERKAIWAKGLPALEKLLKEKGAKTLPVMPTGKVLREDIDNEIWLSSFDALTEGAGSPQVRAGVLRLLSTLPEVAVTSSMTNGQPSLTLTAGSALFGGSGGDVLTIDAKTGMPISDLSESSGVPSVLSTYQVSRVTVAGIKAGKF